MSVSVTSITKAYYTGVYSALGPFVRKRAGQTTIASTTITRFLAYYNTVFARWFFSGLRRGILTPSLELATGAKLNDLILLDDIEYFFKTDGAGSAERANELAELRICIPPPILIKLPPLSAKLHRRLRELHGKNPSDELVWELRALYTGLNDSVNHLSVPAPLKAGLVELFGSPLNTEADYCSPFIIEKEYFGSLGSVFEYSLEINRNYLANPPFDTGTMTAFVVWLEKQLHLTKEVNVIVVLPNWRSSFEAKTLLENSKYRRAITTANREECPFYDYVADRYFHNIGVVIFLLSTSSWEGEHNLNKFKQTWKSFNHLVTADTVTTKKISG